MIPFIVIAAGLLIACVALVAVPLLRPRASKLPPSSITALATAGVLVIGSAVLYMTFSNYPWRKAPGVDSPESMVESLVHKLNDHPDDVEGWLMLGRSYVVLSEYPLAVRAFERADRVAGGRSADALVGEAEALTLIDESSLDGRAGQLIERALAMAPRNPQALFFGAAAAMHQGNLTLARARFTDLLALDPPPKVQAVLRQEIAGIDRQLAGPGAAPGGATAAPAAQVGHAGPAAASAEVRVHVELAPALAGKAPAAAPLYVFVRDPREAGPPLAVKRLASRFPQTVELTSADSMAPGHSFVAGERVQVVARIAPSGNPMPERGDLFGETLYRVGHDGLVNIVIDHVTP
jgi:cytochrome c-type biogenesis protein CcmH